ncbi:hypothetical protein [Exiguobacterium antarcticum]|uniref:hypothetical protein n=1 Tax=Exiguobacterium antarcticum TaxID=132920 RepID=UPI00047B7D21|nr:hypothetical protein [Exiguobacterium antarcticum]
MLTQQYYAFKRLINKYSKDVPYTRTSEGQRDPETGEWLEGTAQTKTISAAVFPVDKNTIYESGGRITSADLLLYSLKPLDVRGTILHKGANWRIEQMGDHTDFADFHRYRLTREAKA